MDYTITIQVTVEFQLDLNCAIDPVRWPDQYTNERNYIFVAPGVIHWEYNAGDNTAEAVNFGFDDHLTEVEDSDGYNNGASVSVGFTRPEGCRHKSWVYPSADERLSTNNKQGHYTTCPGGSKSSRFTVSQPVLSH